MKRILFSLSLLLCLALGAQAQHSDCSKACSAKAGGKSSCEAKVATAQTSIPSDYQTAAAKIASLDAAIEPRTNPVTGEVSYVRKETCAHDGAVSYVALNFDPTTSTFVNVSPTQVAEGAANTQGCGAKSASAKSCCAAGASTKACCAAKNKAAATSTGSSTTVSGSAKPSKTGGSN